MLPASAVALALLIGLLPAYCYLRATEFSRPPVKRDQIMVVLELVAVALGTTGVALFACALLLPALVQTQLDALASGVVDVGMLRTVSGALLVEIGLASGLAFLLSWLHGLVFHKAFSPSVWSGVFDRGRRKDRVLFVTVQLEDGHRVAGLHAAMTSMARTPPAISCWPRPSSYQGQDSHVASRPLTTSLSLNPGSRS